MLAAYLLANNSFSLTRFDSMATLSVSKAPRQLAVVAGCLLLAAYLPHWHKSWFVAESGHFGGGNLFTWLLLLGLYRRWQPALGLTYALVGVQLLVAAYIMQYNGAHGGPLLGFALVSSLHLLALGVLYFSPDLTAYLKGPANSHT